MVWFAIFIVGIIQGIFLIFLIAAKGFKNQIASRLISIILLLIVLTNFGYLVIHTSLAAYIPQFFAVPFGMIFLFGPLFYFYANSVINASFQWRKKYWLHFIPYFIQLLINLPLFFAGYNFWSLFYSAFSFWQFAHSHH